MNARALHANQPNVLSAARLAPLDSLAPTDPRARWLQPPRWSLIGADSVEIVTWTATTEAEVFYGRTAGTTLRGVMRRTSDAVAVDRKTRRISWDAYPWAPAQALRARCP